MTTPAAHWFDRRPDERLCAWVERVLCDARTDRRVADRVRDAKHAELAWLRASMAADGIPETIQTLVIARW